MNQVLCELKEWGCDVDTGLKRVSNDEDFYIECIQDSVHDKYFDELGTALQNQNLNEAYNAAHTLKGLFATLSLTKLYDCVVRIVEPLKMGKDVKLDEEYNTLMQMRSKLEQITMNH